MGFSLISFPGGLDVVQRVRLPQRGVEMRSGLRRGSPHRGESLLSHWNGKSNKQISSSPDQFISDAQNLYNNLTYMYPDSNIWLTGHSLGGGLASLLGMTFGVPVVAFETSGDKLAAERLHLPSPVRFK
jgi:surfactin synthase thioesterase subunit